MGEWFAEFVDFFHWAVDFQSDQISKFEEFSEKITDVFQMCGHAFRAYVCLAARSDVPISREIVI